MKHNKIIVMPDSFKGTISATEVCSIATDVIHKQRPDCQVLALPVADGGEGSVDCFLSALGGQRQQVTVKGPYLEPMEAYYGILPDGVTGVVEMAACAGLPLVKDRKNPCLTSTFGVGELLLDAAKHGCKKIIVGLGGSCTNDAGVGAACAVGIRFLDAAGNSFLPTGGTLQQVAHIDVSGCDSALAGVEIITMCDINNPTYGPNGAAYVFGPQKGADDAMVLLLDKGLAHLCDVIRQDLNLDLSALPGGGAAGGMGAGMVAFFHSQLQMGIETVLDTVRFDQLAADADYVITGEGKLDAQSLSGKVVIGIARRAKKLGVPVIVVTGGYTPELDAAYENGVTAVFTINRLPQDLSVSRFHSNENLRLLLTNLLRILP